ncbi:C-3 sterol dehydrogenase/C-4 decarboxylase family protein [Karstenula rhodostoma CBS 690.94]|uniref:Sterol-4-alpha-carboxylate 3-dehydrogenase ERG26, decarboxylating n=1 Tax=Karstenula rhodostoma CBS 690.94 TaxID=1392251 RepID=A0A9P4P326_9PLEO|nr:C-3 sterol dehydrogenase/C-4 decarboxylase family protein [Karstenula rhodostoma CBS 690.94]
MAAGRTPVPSLGHVTVVGGCGFLGSHIVSLIIKRHPSTRISVLDLRTSSNRNASPQVSYHDGDITDLAALKTLFAELKPDVIIHTASPHFHLPAAVHDKVNIEGTKNLLAAAQETGVKAFVYTSSASVILGPETELVNANEDWPMVTGAAQPEYYTTTKAYAETAVLEANRTPTSFLTCAIRPAGIFGEGDVQLLPPIISAFRKGQTKFQVGANDNLFDFTYVENVAYGHLLAAQHLLHTHKILPTVPLDHERVDGEAFFITNGQPVYFWDFARAVWHEAGDRRPLSGVWKLDRDFAMGVGAVLENLFWALGRTPNITRKQVRYSTLNKYHNIDKAKRRLGYAPLVQLDEGVRRGVRWHVENEAKQAQKKDQ